MIRGKNVVLRTIRKEDLIPYMEMDSLVEEQGSIRSPRQSSFQNFQKSFENTGFWEENKGRLLICAPNGRLLGSIGYFKQNQYVSSFEIGYKIFLRSDRGKGYMSEALSLFSAFLFLSKDIPRLQIVTDAENLASRKVAEKCGYRYEVRMRRYALTRGVPKDHVMYSLLREECPEAPELQGF